MDRASGAGCLPLVALLAVVLVGLSLWRAFTFDPADWPVLAQAAAAQGVPVPGAPRGRVPVPDHGSVHEVAPEDDLFADGPDEPVERATGTPRVDGPVPRPRRLDERCGWEQGPGLVADHGRAWRVFDPAEWPPRESSAMNAYIDAPVAPVRVAMAVDSERTSSPRPVIECRWDSGSVDRAEFEINIGSSSGWVAIAGSEALGAEWRALGSDAVVGLQGSGWQHYTPDLVEGAAKAVRAVGLELAFDPIRKVWAATGASAEQVKAANARLQPWGSFRIVTLASQEWHEIQATGAAIALLGPADRRWGLAVHAALPGRWIVESLHRGGRAVGFRLRHAP